MIAYASNTGYPRHYRPAVLDDLRSAAPWITLPLRRSRVIVTDVSPMRDRRFTPNVTD